MKRLLKIISPMLFMLPFCVSPAAEFADVNNKFAFDLGLKFESASSENVVYCPIGISQVIAQYCASTSDAECGDFLNFFNTKSTREDFFKKFRAEMYGATSSDLQDFFLSGNYVLLSDKFSFNPEFLKDMRTYFNARAENVDFADTASVTKILNEYALEATRGMIKQVSNPSDKLTAAMFINFSAFKGIWQKEFNPAVKSDFTLPDSTRKKVDMMRVESKDIDVVSLGDFTCVRIPFKSGKYSMIAVMNTGAAKLRDFDFKRFCETLSAMPPSAHSASAVAAPSFEFSADAASVSESPKKSEKCRVVLEFPKFSVLGCDLDVLSQLRELGMPISDYRRLSSNIAMPMFEYMRSISNVIVDEKGCEATAYTYLAASYSAAPKSKFVKFDRPFKFFIVENSTSMILFAGRINNPNL